MRGVGNLSGAFRAGQWRWEAVALPVLTCGPGGRGQGRRRGGDEGTSDGFMRDRSSTPGTHRGGALKTRPTRSIPAQTRGVLSVLLLAAFILAGCSSQKSAGDVFDMLLDDTSGLLVYDIEAINAGESIEEFSVRLENDWDLMFGAMGIPMDQASTLLVGIEQDSSQYSVLSGEFDYDGIREDLDRQGYRDDEYRGYEVWTDGALLNASTVALIEDDGIVLAGNFDLVPNILRDLSMESDDAEELTVVRALEGAPDGWLSRSVNRCPTELRDCEAWASAVSSGERHELVIVHAFMFGDDRSAESQRDTIEDLSENMEFSELQSVKLDGEYVTLSVTVAEGDFYRELSFRNETLGFGR